MTAAQQNRIESLLIEYAGEPLEFQWNDGEVTAIGSELAILRIHFRYNRHVHCERIRGVGEAKGLGDGRWFLAIGG